MTCKTIFSLYTGFKLCLITLVLDTCLPKEVTTNGSISKPVFVTVRRTVNDLCIQSLLDSLTVAFRRQIRYLEYFHEYDARDIASPADEFISSYSYRLPSQTSHPLFLLFLGCLPRWFVCLIRRLVVVFCVVSIFGCPLFVHNCWSAREYFIIILVISGDDGFIFA